jgi:hypothetical protein
MVMSCVHHKAFLYPKPNTYDTKKRGADDEEFWRQDSTDLRGLVAAAGGRGGITPYPSSSVPRGFLLYLRTTPEGGRWEEPLQYSRNTAERYWLDLYAYNDCNTLCCRFAALLLVFCLFLNRLVFYPSLVWRKEDAIDLHVDIR